MSNEIESPLPEEEEALVDETPAETAPAEEKDVLVEAEIFMEKKPSDEEDSVLEEVQSEDRPSSLAREWQWLRSHLRLIVFLTSALVMVGIVCLVLFYGARISSYMERTVRYSGEPTVFTFDAHNSNAYVSFHRGLAVASVDGLQCFNAKGEQVALLQNQMDTPTVLENGTVAMCYGVGGSKISTSHYAKGEQLSIEVPGTLIDADLSDGTKLCYSFIQPGYKTVLSVLNEAGDETYRWYSSTQFFSQCAVSEQGDYLAAIALGIDGSSYMSEAVLFATDQSEPITRLALGSDLIFDLTFMEEKLLCAVGESSLQFFDVTGNQYVHYSFGGSELMCYDLHGDGFTSLVCNTNQAGSRYRIVTVDSSGHEMASVSLDEEVLDISANGQYLAVLTGSSLRVYDKRLHLTLQEDDVDFATRVCVQADGAALLISGSSARRVW